MWHKTVPDAVPAEAAFTERDCRKELRLEKKLWQLSNS